MLIANPIYDAVFKYLMDDLAVARVIISTIIGQDIQELDFKQRERSAQVPSLGATIFRLDFSAVIKTADGTRKNVLIEIQKADSGEDIGRFRRYLAENYYTPPPPKTLGKAQSPPGAQEGRDPDKTREFVPEEAPLKSSEELPAAAPETALGANAPLLPIITIYILGFPLRKLKGYPGIIIRRDYYDATSGDTIAERDEFIEHLTHDCYVIQVSELKQRRRNKLEQLISLFEQMNLEGNGHLKLYQGDLAEEFHVVLERLARAARDKALREEMDVEDEFLELLKRKERSHAEALDAVMKKLKEARAREEEERRKKEEALAELTRLKRKLEPGEK